METPMSPQQHKCRAVILSPTRELSMQTLKVMNKISHFTELKSIGINGGEGMEKQFHALASKPDIIVATPGRLAHHLSEIPDFDLKGCLMCVLDEADRLLEMGFAAQIREIASTLPDYCQKVLLSATMPKVLVEFTKTGFATDPQVVRLDQEASVSADLRIAFVTCRSADKDAALLHLLHHIKRDKKENEASRTGLTLIFAATRHHVEYISNLLTVSGFDSTYIYGTLNQEARKSHLSAFRSGRKSVLVVTDVAARGIDVPLIDHVIHYAFPANAKLFVHRSGRAARAGRIGFCWGLVDPDEMPYMVDLHLFLGRRLDNGQLKKTADNEKIKDVEEPAHYTLSEMTPEMVHYGSIPESIMTREVENARRVIDSELTGSNEAESLRALTRVCKNAMKQYLKSRPEASREGVRRAKAILEGERQETGKRVGGGAILPHPLLYGMERRDFLERKKNGKVDALHDLGNLKKREEFLRAMSNFRPKETVFEAFATGGGKDSRVASQVDRGRTSGVKKHDSSAAFSAMKSMRRQMRMAHDKGSSLVVAGTANAQLLSGDAEEGCDKSGEEPMQVKLAAKPVAKAKPADTKRRLSKAERKKLKKGQKIDTSKSTETGKKGKNMRGDDFKDMTFFIENDLTPDTAAAARSRQIEAAMQPSSASNMKNGAIRLEEAMVDILGDEQTDLVQRQRMMRWDKSKRKYIQTTVGSELSGDSKSKKLRLESGQVVKSSKMKLGELYEKWQKKTNRSIGRSGVFDDVTETDHDSGFSSGFVVASGKDGKGEKPKTASQIRKEREAKADVRLKNMKRSDRKRVESDNRQARAPTANKKGYQGKKGASGRWASNSGKKE